MSVRIDRSSRLLLSEYIQIDDIEFFDIVDLPAYTSSQDDIKHVVSDGDRMDLLAFKYYQDSALHWALTWANDMDLASSELYSGQVLAIPSVAHLQSVLGKK